MAKRTPEIFMEQMEKHNRWVKERETELAVMDDQRRNLERELDLAIADDNPDETKRLMKAVEEINADISARRLILEKRRNVELFDRNEVIAAQHESVAESDKELKKAIDGLIKARETFFREYVKVCQIRAEGLKTMYQYMNVAGIYRPTDNGYSLFRAPMKMPDWDIRIFRDIPSEYTFDQLLHAQHTPHTMPWMEK